VSHIVMPVATRYIGEDGLHRLVRDLLEGPWSGTEQVARTAACIVEGHPRVHDDPTRDCYCRLVKATS
jgi:hypothetical protein